LEIEINRLVLASKPCVLNVVIAMQFEGGGELIHSRDNIAVLYSRMSSALLTYAFVTSDGNSSLTALGRDSFSSRSLLNRFLTSGSPLISEMLCNLTRGELRFQQSPINRPTL